jgi:hypothetical protein
MKQLLLSVLILFCLDVAYAQSDIYVCTDAKGVRTFGNVGDNKGCKKVDLPGLTTFPAPKTKRAGKAPSDFPKVSDTTQKNRDLERKQILDNELKTEQKKLADLNSEYKNGEPDRLGNERNYAKYQERTENLKQDINRTQKNIEAIQREIGGLN